MAMSSLVLLLALPGVATIAVPATAALATSPSAAATPITVPNATAPPAAADDVEQPPLPDLPEVSDVMQEASHSVDAFAAKAASMQEQVALKQKASKDALAESKRRYEELLDELDNKSAQLVNGSNQIRGELSTLMTTNQDLKAEAERLQKSNAWLWNSLEHLKAKIEAATQFTADSLRLSDLAGSPYFDVLEGVITPPQSLDDFLKVAHGLKTAAAPGAAGAPQKASLLQVQMASPDAPKERRAVETYVPMLAKSLEDLDAAVAEGEATLRADFESVAAEKKKNIDALVAERQSLKETRSEYRSKNADLTKARDHLLDRRKQLVARLGGLRDFATSIGKEAYSVMKEHTPASMALPPMASPAATAPVHAPISGNT